MSDLILKPAYRPKSIFGSAANRTTKHSHTQTNQESQSTGILKGRYLMQLRYCLSALSAVAMITAALISANPAYAVSDKPVIALANSFNGNTWRHQMVKSFEAAAKKAQKAGNISNYIILNGDNSVSQQNSQIANLILKNVDAIAVDAASKTAVNGIIQKACKAGIDVVSFDSVASAPCNYQLNFDFTRYQKKQARWILNKIGGKGNIIQVRGVKGSAPDQAMYEGQEAVLKQYPKVHVVATVYGQATASVTQSKIANILPSLPKIDAVLNQGGSDAVGVLHAFQQYGGQYKNDMPIISGDGTTDFLKWWAREHKKNGYTTVSRNSTPGIGSAAFNLALEIAKGAKPPRKMTMPVVTITQDNLSEYTDLPSGRIVSPNFTQEWVRKNLINEQE